MYLYGLAILLIIIYTSRTVLRKSLLQKYDKIVILWMVCVVSAVILTPFAISTFNIMLVIANIGILCGVGLIYTLIDPIIYRLYAKTDVSLITPLENISIISSLLFGWVILNEKVSGINIIGIIIVIIGVYFLELDLTQHSILQPFKAIIADRNSQLILLIAFGFGLLKVVDKIGVLAFEPLQWVWLTFCFEAVTLSIYVARKSKTEVLKSIKSPWVWVYSISGCVYFLCDAFLVKELYVVYVQILGVVGLLLTVLLSHFVYKEKNLLERLTGTSLIGVGVMIIALMRL